MISLLLQVHRGQWRLTCLIENDGMKTFEVNISKNDTIHTLKQCIYDVRRSLLKDIDSVDLELFKVKDVIESGINYVIMCLNRSCSILVTLMNLHDL